MKNQTIIHRKFEILNQWKHLEKEEVDILLSVINNTLHESDAIRAILLLTIRCADLRRRLAEGGKG